jgi:hypothetical protein
MSWLCADAVSLLFGRLPVHCSDFRIKGVRKSKRRECQAKAAALSCAARTLCPDAPFHGFYKLFADIESQAHPGP